MEQKVDYPPIDVTHLKNSTKRKDLEAIIAIGPQKLTVKQKKEANRLGLLALVEINAFVRAKRDLNLYDYEVGKLLDTGLYNGLSEGEVIALEKSAANKVRHLKKKDPEEVKKMAQKMIKDQNKEITDFKTWLSSQK